MTGNRFLRYGMMFCTGAIMLQAGGCVFTDILTVANTVLLGVTAAGAVAIIQNI